jgi:U3 small nucleolar RNA-associated protein 21
MFNMQSGLHRRCFGGKQQHQYSSSSTNTNTEGGHSKAVTALASDNTNQRLVSSSLDQTVKLWDLPSGRCLRTFQLDSPVTGMHLQQESDLVAVCCDDLSIFIIDIDTRKIVRHFTGHKNRIMDMVIINIINTTLTLNSLKYAGIQS